MKQKVKELRVQIDGLAQLTKDLKSVCVQYMGDSNEYETSSTQTEKATDSLYLAKAWLGKVLKELGEDSPYANDGKRKTVEDIEPTADTASKEGLEKVEHETWYGSNNSVLAENILTQEQWDKKNHIEKVDWLRQEIGEMVKESLNIHTELQQYYEQELQRLEQIECEVLKGGGEYDLSEELSKLPNPETELTFAWKCLSEARFWLGFELERVKKEHEKVEE